MLIRILKLIHQNVDARSLNQPQGDKQALVPLRHVSLFITRKERYNVNANIIQFKKNKKTKHF